MLLLEVIKPVISTKESIYKFKICVMMVYKLHTKENSNIQPGGTL